MPVHLYGQSADMDPLMALAKQYQLESDRGRCAGHRHGIQERRARRLDRRHRLLFILSEQESRRVRRRGPCAPPTMPILAESMRVLRVHGGKPKYFHAVIGGNFQHR